MSGTCIEAKIFTPRIIHIDIPGYFLKENFYNDIFAPKYENSSFITEDMCTKPCSGPIISWGTKCVTSFTFYPTSDT